MNFLIKKTAHTIPIHPLNSATLPTWLKKQDKAVQAWVAASGFTAEKGVLLAVPAKNGDIMCMLYGVNDQDTLYAYASLPAKLPQNKDGYYIDQKMTADQATQAALGWMLGSYQFANYISGKKTEFAALVMPENADQHVVQSTAEAVFLVRDLVNTPANDLGPEELANAAENLIKPFKARMSVITGNELLKKNYPAIHAVGKGSPRLPRLIDIRWGDKKHPLIALVGKGVCFDTGGLDIKPGSAMALMKKDMGGAAHVLGLAYMIMAQKLPVQLRVLIPAVENSTDGHSYRPGDIIHTRKGLTVEVGDTDAEGRIVLADALAEASTENPALIVDFATLTGAARVALGPDLPAMFCNDDDTAYDLLKAATSCEDPLWRLPLWQPYKDMLKSKVADTNNIGGSHAGAITAALFMEKFVGKDIPWVHIDTFAWNPSSKPGKPEGGEALGMRAVFAFIQQKFGKHK